MSVVDPSSLNLRIGFPIPKCHHSFGQRCSKCCDVPMDYDESVIVVVPPTEVTPVRADQAEHQDS